MTFGWLRRPLVHAHAYRSRLLRLASLGGAYQGSALLSAALGLLTYRVYTGALGLDGMGFVDSAVTAITLASIAARLGLDEAAMRFSTGAGSSASILRRRVVRAATSASIVVAWCVAALAWALLGGSSLPVVGALAFGVLAYTSLEVRLAFLRADGRHIAYARAAYANVVLTSLLCVAAVLLFDAGIAGYLYANYTATALVAISLTFMEASSADVLSQPQIDESLSHLLRYGAPFALMGLLLFSYNLADRALLAGFSEPESVGRALGVYAGATKLAAVVIIVGRSAQLMGPPRVYASSDATASVVDILRAYTSAGGMAVIACSAAVPALTYVVIDSSADNREAIVNAFPFVCGAWVLWGATSIASAGVGATRRPAEVVMPATLGLVAVLSIGAFAIPSLEATGAALALVGGYLVYLGALQERFSLKSLLSYSWPVFFGVGIGAVMQTSLIGAGPASQVVWRGSLLMLGFVLILRSDTGRGFFTAASGTSTPRETR